MIQVKRIIGFCALMSLFCFGLVANSVAQESFEVSVNRNPARQGDQIQLTLTLKNVRQNLKTPEIKGLKFVFGPSTSQSNSWVNGVSTSEIAYTYTYQVVSKSDIEIPALSITVGNKRLQSEPFTLKVVERSQVNNSGGNRILDDVACVIEVSKQNVFIGEPVLVSFKIYNRSNNLDVREYNIPEMTGFWKEQIEMPDPRWEPQIIDGRRYNVANVRSVLLFPQQTGELEISGFNLIGYMRMSFFDGKNVTANANPVRIKVNPLPEPIPAKMLGSFARLSSQYKLSSSNCKTNEAITLDVIFNGDGNLKFIQEPDLKWPGEFEVYDPEVIDRIRITEKGESGSRTFRYVFIPRAEGAYQMPALADQYFNLKTKRYTDLVASPLTLTVERGEGTADFGMSFNSKTDIQVLNQDIRFIQTEWTGNCLPRNRWDNRKAVMSGFLSIGPALLGLAWFTRRRRDEEERNPLGTRRKKARATVRQELKAAKKAMNDPVQFFPALGHGLESYLLAKLGWNSSQNQRSALRDQLLHHAPEVADQWMLLLEKLDMARYAPASAPQTDILYHEAEELVNKTEKTWRA